MKTIALIALVALTGCATPNAAERVERMPPAAAMVHSMPLSAQEDPTLGGLFRGYADAARQYRGCVDRQRELQDWVAGSSCVKR